MAVTNVIGECPFCKRVCTEDDIILDEDKKIHLIFNCPCGGEWDEVFALDYRHADIITNPEEENEIDLDDEDEDDLDKDDEFEDKVL